MATRSQRKQRKRNKKRKRKAQQQRKRSEGPVLNARILAGSNARHRQRLEQQKPRGWPGETPEDVAVFDDSVLQSLPPEIASQVSCVREALQQACESRGEAALQSVSGIPRRSPLSEWRVFLRGLVPWLANDTESAGDAWKRLNPERRAGRIAVAMMAAHRTDLDGRSADRASQELTDSPQIDWSSGLDDQLLYHAKLLRRVRLDRAAIRVAEAGTETPEESQRILLGPAKIAWLQAFAAEYRATEPDLVAALEHVALRRAFMQTFVDLFESARTAFAGPQHDPHNLLISFFYYMRFTDSDTDEERLEEYLTKDLPQNEKLPKPLRQAIGSQIHLNQAMTMIQPSGGGMMDFLFGAREDTTAIAQHFKSARQLFPANRRAHKAHADWIIAQLENEQLTKPKRQPLEKRLASVMKGWAKGRPDDVEPRLWLVDYLLENEETSEARPHVDWLAVARHDDPRVRATPWKWQLLEAMRLSRRKAWLSEVPARLAEAEQQWPAWVSPQWLPYLKAAWTLRCGRSDEFEQLREQICSASGVTFNSLADACMMLGAAQRMRVPAADLKPLRAIVDAAAKKTSALSYEELLLTSGFFWDLHRARLLYPAYRMHGVKFLRELASRWEEKPKLVLDHRDDERLHAAMLVCSQHQLWGDSNRAIPPSWSRDPAIRQHAVFAAALLNAFLRRRYHWQYEKYKDSGPLLRSAAPQQPDPYNRYWFVVLADELDDAIARQAARYGFDLFGSRPGADYDDDDDDDDDDDWNETLGYDPTCDCPECTAARRAHECPS